MFQPGFKEAKYSDDEEEEESNVEPRTASAMSNDNFETQMSTPADVSDPILVLNYSL
jgi:hypothetical protein